MASEDISAMTRDMFNGTFLIWNLVGGEGHGREVGGIGEVFLEAFKKDRYIFLHRIFLPIFI